MTGKFIEIYGICGKKGHGKDTFARMVAENDPQFQIIHFADDLKAMCGLVFGLSDYQLHDPVGKEEKFPDAIGMDEYLADMCKVTGLDISPKGLVAESSRQVMQYFGSDYVRSVKDSYWIDRTIDKTLGGGKFLIPDTRFPNEEKALRAIGGQVIRVMRLGQVKDKNSQHSSETEMEKIEPDYTLSFREGELSKMRAAALSLAKPGLVNEIGMFDPQACLKEMVENFNNEYQVWVEEFGWGANIQPYYTPEGLKKYRVGDMAPLPAQTATPEQVEKAGKTLHDALQESLQAGVATEPAHPTPSPYHEGDLL